jgi:hypothetical protein
MFINLFHTLVTSNAFKIVVHTKVTYPHIRPTYRNTYYGRAYTSLLKPSWRRGCSVPEAWPQYPIEISGQQDFFVMVPTGGTWVNNETVRWMMQKPPNKTSTGSPWFVETRVGVHCQEAGWQMSEISVSVFSFVFCSHPKCLSHWRTLNTDRRV